MKLRARKSMTSKIKRGGREYETVDVEQEVRDIIRRHRNLAMKKLDDDDDASTQQHLSDALDVEKAMNLKRKKMYKPAINICQKLCLALYQAMKKDAEERDAMLVQQQRTKQSGTQINLTCHHSPAKRQPRPHAVKPKNVGQKDAELVQQHTKRLTVSINFTRHPSPAKRQPRPRS